MCLSHVHKWYKGTSKKVYEVFKVFQTCDEGRLRFEYFSLSGQRIEDYGNPAVPRRKWLTAKTVQINGSQCDGEYPSGFHCFVHEGSAGSWKGADGGLIVIRVKAKGLLAVGTQGGRDVFVFKHIWVP